MTSGRFIASIVYPQLITATWYIYALVLLCTSAEIGVILSFLAAAVPTIIAVFWIGGFISDTWSWASDMCKGHALYIRNTVLSLIHANLGWFGITGLLAAFSLFPTICYVLATLFFIITSVGGFIWLMYHLASIYK